uniref:Galactokinase 2 n=1 Tax=Oryzias latipes TaxID=8090 RepID=A0A3B3HVC1_ORYLA
MRTVEGKRQPCGSYLLEYSVICRLKNLKNAFEAKYGESPLFYTCAPGRVNLIGEHIDYCGYSVLPMAIEQNILAAVSVNNSGMIQLANINPQYKDYKVSCSEDIAINKDDPKWYYYFLCGVKGIQEKFGIPRLAGMSCVVDGSIPPSSGLSSSSALVCCADMCQMHGPVHFFSGRKRHCAKLIEFHPLRATDVKLPEGAVFVISNCCKEMNKAASSHYNIRVVECRIATKMLAHHRGLDPSKVSKLSQVQTELNASLEEMLAMVEEVFHPEPYTREEICKLLSITSEKFSTEVLSANTQQETHFKLYQRSKHVYGEAARVMSFKSVCDSEPVDAIRLLGDLMNQSHVSCRDLYECSCPELDQLVDICLKSGAVGSRLTGAGWGGCAVSMVPSKKMESFLKAVRDAYYTPDPRRAAMEKQSLFVSKPAGGAALFLED